MLNRIGLFTKEVFMGNFQNQIPDIDGLLLSSRVPCEQRSKFKKQVRFYLHFCKKYPHNPADAKKSVTGNNLFIF